MIQIRGRGLSKSWRRFFSIVYLLISLLILLVTYDSFARGTSFLSVAILGTILGILGITSSIFIWRGGPYARFIAIWTLLVGGLYYVSYGMINKEILVNPGILFVVTFLLVSNLLFMFRSPAQKRKESKPLRISMKIIITIVFLVVLVPLLLIPWESKINLVFEPNQEGAESYENDEFKIEVQGGFVYRVHKVLLFSDNDIPEIAIKSKAPETRIIVTPKKDTGLRLNFLGIARGEESIEVDGKNIGPNPYLSGEVLALSLENGNDLNPGVVETKEYVESRKGAWIDLELKSGEEKIVNLRRETENDRVHFYVVSDLHSGYSVSFPVLYDILHNNADFVVWNGDIVNDGYRSEYRTASALSELFPVPVYTTIGNHDTWNGGEDIYRDFFGKSDYSFHYKGYLFVFLDNESGYVEEEQFTWLKGELENGTPGKIIVFSHMPPIDTVSGKFDDKDYPNAELRHSMFEESESDKLMQLFSDYGVSAHIAGHTHEHGDVTIGGVRYITSGALGGTVNAGDSVSYLEVTEEGEEVIFANHDVLESYEIENQEVRNKLHAARVFAGPFLVDKSIRANLFVLWLIAFSYFVIYRLRGRKEKK